MAGCGAAVAVALIVNEKPALALFAMVTVAVDVPTAVGLNATVNMVELPAATVAPGGAVSDRTPDGATVTPLMVRSAFPVLPIVKTVDVGAPITAPPTVTVEPEVTGTVPCDTASTGAGGWPMSVASPWPSTTPPSEPALPSGCASADAPPMPFPPPPFPALPPVPLESVPESRMFGVPADEAQPTASAAKARRAIVRNQIGVVFMNFLS